jgi:phosphoglycerate dehydrogenase-like enzyme
MTRSKPAVAVLDDWESRWTASPELDRLRPLADLRIVTGHLLGLSELAAVARDASVLVLNRERTRIDAAVLAELPNLRAIVNTGAGLNHINRAAVESRGVRLSTTGGRSCAVAEQTFALMLAAVKQLPQLDRGLRCGRFPVQPLVGDLEGKRLGIVGVGTIGARVARIAAAFGMRVTGWSPHLSDEKAEGLGIARAAGLFELARSSDVLSLHLRLVPKTRGIVSAEVIGALPPGALFVNTARAELVDTQALLARAERGELTLALDVFDNEPEIDPRYRALRGAFSPHVGWKSEGTWDEFVRLGVDRVLEALASLSDEASSQIVPARN